MSSETREVVKPAITPNNAYGRGEGEDIHAVIRSLADIPEKKRLKMRLGMLMMKLFWWRARQLEKGKAQETWGGFDRLLRNGLQARAFHRDDHALHRAMFSQYWAHEGDTDESVWEGRFLDEFLVFNVELVDVLESYLEAGSYQQLYELGCGHGQVADYLANRLQSLSSVVGIDISAIQIEKNRKKYNHPNVSFLAGDAVSLVKTEGKPGSVFLTNGGIFEYFLQDEVETIFQHIAQNLAPAIVGVIEPVGTDHDLENELTSLVFGRELSFSHNYPHLMKQAGFKVVYQTERRGVKKHGGIRWLRALGVIEAQAG